jgi:PhnB protein
MGQDGRRQRGGKKMVQPIPEGYRSLTPYLTVAGAAAAIEFYVRAFGARERMRLPMPGGRVGHAELQIGDSLLMLADEFPDMEVLGPQSIGGTPVRMHLYVADVDAAFAQALAAGAEQVRKVENMFYGDRSGELRDPYGHLWHLASHVEDVAPEEMARRMQEMFSSGG